MQLVAHVFYLRVCVYKGTVARIDGAAIDSVNGNLQVSDDTPLVALLVADGGNFVPVTFNTGVDFQVTGQDGVTRDVTANEAGTLNDLVTTGPLSVNFTLDLAAGGEVALTDGTAAGTAFEIDDLAGSDFVDVLFGVTGGAETLAPDMAAGAELAMSEASESGLFLGGSKAVPVRADSTCGDAALATAAAERLVTAELVNGIVGAICSGASGAVLQNVSVPNGMVQISPSSTSPGLSTMEDDGFFFRTAPSDARQGQVIAEMLQEMGISSAALTYTNNDYGKGLADSIEANFQALGGTITLNAAHEDDKAEGGGLDVLDQPLEGLEVGPLEHRGFVHDDGRGLSEQLRPLSLHPDGAHRVGV